MKLLTRTSVFYFLFSLILFIAGGIIFYHTIQKIFYNQIDDTLITEKKLIQEQINYSDSLPDFRAMFGHMIDVQVQPGKHKESVRLGDTLVMQDDSSGMLPCRHLEATGTSSEGKGYRIRILKPTHETEYLITAILIAMSLLFVSLMALLLLVNYVISKSVWHSFYRTLRALNQYSLQQEEPLTLAETSITEFRSLNRTLERMSQKIRRDFISLKEFNENASHELQTPLAIIKSKLELLIQNEQLTPEQMNLIHAVYDATTRISRLNQGLLLISRIGNNQFGETEAVDPDAVIRRNLDHFGELIRMKNLECTYSCPLPIVLNMNPALAEILVANLLSNAVRHNIPNGTIRIELHSDLLQITNTGQPLSVPPQHLFSRFRKADRTSDSAGLGLAIAQQITELYGWRIKYECEDTLHSVTVFFHRN